MLNLVYLDNTLALVKSLLIKSDLVALETEYTVTNSPDYTKPREWKYYMNVCGQYHSTDIAMTIDSLDDLEPIAFTADVIDNHPITKTRLMQFGDDFAKLVARYPNQILLIYGILYQPNMDEVIKCDECTILGWNTAVVEPQELDLIISLEARLKRYAYQVASVDWNRLERGYSVVYLAKIAVHALYALRAERVARKWTGQTHSYFIWNYINSHVYLEDLKDFMTTPEVMFLYKNIKRLKSASGSANLQDELFAKFITTRGIKGYNLKVQRDTEALGSDGSQVVNYTDIGINTLKTRKRVVEPLLNTHVNRSLVKLDDYEDRVNTKMLFSKDQNGTREITLVDDTAVTPVSRLTKGNVDLSFQLIPYNTGAYTVVNHIQNTTHNLTYHECCILYVRLVQQRTGALTVNIPNFCSGSIPKAVKPLATYLADKYYLPLYAANALVAAMPVIPTELNDVVAQTKYKNYHEKWRLWVTTFLRGHTNHVNAHNIDRIYGEFLEYLVMDLVPTETNYQAWLDIRGISLADLDNRDIYIIELSILNSVFKIDVENGDTTTSVKLADLLSRFAAYHININAEVSGNTTLPSRIISVISSPLRTTAPEGLGLDLTQETKLHVPPLPAIYPPTGGYPTNGKQAGVVAGLRIPTIHRLSVRTLRIEKPMTTPSLLEH